MLDYLYKKLKEFLRCLNFTYLAGNLTNHHADSLVKEAACSLPSPSQSNSGQEQSLTSLMPAKVQAQLQQRTDRGSEQAQTLNRLNRISNSRPSQEGNIICWYNEATKKKETSATELLAQKHVAALKTATGRQTHCRILIENLQTVRNDN
ncbi:MAG: hypothetical protein SFV17_21930 [Candidatus Obscuribacter sp.]|nr:hypothetical protein [Candidatus Obscuribacter sp.]